MNKLDELMWRLVALECMLGSPRWWMAQINFAVFALSDPDQMLNDGDPGEP